MEISLNDPAEDTKVQSEVTHCYPVINFGFSIATKLVTRKSAPIIFKKRITARKNPIIAWNINGETTQKSIPMVRVVEI
jgi:hypothetical protein